RELQTAAARSGERRKGPVQATREPLGVTDKTRRPRVLADADQNALACRPWSANGARLHLCEQLLVDPFRGAAQGQLAQGREVGRREEMLKRTLSLLGNVDLSFAHPFDQIVRSEINGCNRVGAVKDGIGHGLTDAHMGDLRDHVIEALDVLDINCRIDVDTVVQQLFDIEIALWVTAARGIGMSELIDKHNLRTAGNDEVEI